MPNPPVNAASDAAAEGGVARPDKMRFIFNPGSGRAGRNIGLLPLVRGFVATRGLDAEVVATEGPGHATALAREAVQAGCGRIVAVGGDGTVNEVAQALRRTPAVLAIVPSGSGNGLARHLRLPSGARRALELACDPSAPVRPLDAGAVDGLPFFSVAGFGLDADVSRRFNRRRRRGLPAYVRAVAAAYLGRSVARCRIDGPAGRLELETILVAAANSDQYGNNARIAPGARADDGELELVAVRPVGPAGAAILIARLFLGTFARSPKVARLRAPRFRVDRGGPGLLHTDGEVHDGGAVLEIAVEPRSLRIIAP